MSPTSLFFFLLLGASFLISVQADHESDYYNNNDHFNTAGRPGRGAFRGFTVVRPRTIGHIDVIDAREYDDDDFIVEAGVSKECLVKLDNIAWQVRTYLPSHNTFICLFILLFLLS